MIHATTPIFLRLKWSDDSDSTPRGLSTDEDAKDICNGIVNVPVLRMDEEEDVAPSCCSISDMLHSCHR